MIRKIALGLLLWTPAVFADTMDHYMNIVENIPKMEMKADPQAQAWARSARNVLAITAESIAETLMEANAVAQSQGKPLFCLPAGNKLDSQTMNNLIQQTFREMASQDSQKTRLTVSQVAWEAVRRQYPCQPALSQG